MELWNVHRMGEKTRSNKVKFLASYFELYIVMQSSGREFPSIKNIPWSAPGNSLDCSSITHIAILLSCCFLITIAELYIKDKSILNYNYFSIYPLTEVDWVWYPFISDSQAQKFTNHSLWKLDFLNWY